MRKPSHCKECGAVQEEEKHSRSTPQHRRQMALFAAAFHHWPEREGLFRPKNKDHLRYWLETEAGHYDVVKTIRVESVDPDKLAALLTAVLRTSEDDKMFVEANDDYVVVTRTKSIAYEKLEHPEACRLFDQVAEVLYAHDIDADQLLKEAEKAA